MIALSAARPAETADGILVKTGVCGTTVTVCHLNHPISTAGLSTGAAFAGGAVENRAVTLMS